MNTVFLIFEFQKRTINQYYRISNFVLIHEMIFDKVLIDETAEKRTLIPTDNQMINI